MVYADIQPGFIGDAQPESNFVRRSDETGESTNIATAVGRRISGPLDHSFHGEMNEIVISGVSETLFVSRFERACSLYSPLMLVR